MSRLGLVMASGALTLAILTSIILYNTAVAESSQVPVGGRVPPPLQHPKRSQQDLAERLAGAIRIPTVSYDPSRIQDQAYLFLKLHKYLESAFPLTFGSLPVHKLGKEPLSLLLEWRGEHYGQPEDRPILLTSHLDVVPVPEDTLPLWNVDPFAGIVDDEFIWVSDRQNTIPLLVNSCLDRDEGLSTTNKEF